jgi:hypothetical protein
MLTLMRLPGSKLCRAATGAVQPIAAAWRVRRVAAGALRSDAAGLCVPVRERHMLTYADVC